MQTPFGDRIKIERPMPHPLNSVCHQPKLESLPTRNARETFGAALGLASSNAKPRGSGTEGAYQMTTKFFEPKKGKQQKKKKKEFGDVVTSVESNVVEDRSTDLWVTRKDWMNLDRRCTKLDSLGIQGRCKQPEVEPLVLVKG